MIPAGPVSSVLWEPGRARLLRAGRLGAGLVILCAILIAFITRSEGGVSFQPAERQVTPALLAALMQEHATGALEFFAADTLLAAGYLLAFLGLHAARARQVSHLSRLSGLALAAGVVMMLSDLTENAFYVRQALAALSGSAPASDLRWLHAVTAVKEWSAGMAFLGFALCLPRGGVLQSVLRALMLLVPAIGLASLVRPELIPARGAAVILPMPFIMVWLNRLAAGDSPR